MEQYIEKSGIKYELRGEQYYPCLELPEQTERPIGVWGRRHLEYLKEHRKGTYTELLSTCKLNEYLAGIDEDVQMMFNSLVTGMAAREGVTEQLKAANQMLWVQGMNGIRYRAEETVNKSIIYA